MTIILCGQSEINTSFYLGIPMSEIIEPFETITGNRKNLVLDWCGTDTEEAYKPLHDDIPNQYKPEDFKYSFNSDGFRCDEFDIPSDFPIIFIGCSVTEGIGLPVTDVWSYVLLEKIRAKTGWNIPYWNLSIGGGGFETMASTLMWFSRRSSSKPKIILSLFPPIYRREFCYEDSSVRWWSVPHKEYPNQINRLFSDDHFAIHQGHRSIQTIEALRLYFDASLIYSTWDPLEHNAFKTLNKSHRIEFPPLIFGNGKARDGIHYGAKLHRVIALRYWRVVEPLLQDLQHAGQ